MAAPTCQAVAKVILRDWGIMYLDPLTPTNQTNPIRAVDLEAVAQVMTSAFQEIADEANSEAKNQIGSAVLNAVTTSTATVTAGSKVMSSFAGYSSWMLGCTIRIDGDSQDNEILSSTALAKPYIGTTGSRSVTVYADAITLDETTGRVIPPLLLGDNTALIESSTRSDFITQGKYRVPGFYSEKYASHPFWAIGSKPSAPTPSTYFIDGYYDPTLDYIVRRIRFSPMPTELQVVSWTASINPQRVATTDIDGALHVDPGVKIPCPNGWVESIFLPVARQIATSCPQFKNSDIKNEIGRQYSRALSRLKDSNGSSTPARTRYI